MMERPKDEDARSDEALMAAHVAGDTAAFGVLFERYSGILLALARRQMFAGQDAADLVQQTFLHVHRARRDFRPDGKFRPWLFTIARNVRLEHFRKLGRRPESQLDLELGEPATGPDRSEARLAVRAALGRLPPSQREAIHLHWFEGYSMAEIAALVGASVSAVKVRVHRGYQALRKVLAPASGHRTRPTGIPEEGGGDGLR